MQISVIIPVYRVEDYLEACVESVLANDLEDCEIILVDDGSPDSCGAICDRYAARYPAQIRVIHQENGGLGAARNTGMEAASGTYFLFVDSDDRIHPDTVAILKQAIAREPEAEIVGFQFFSDNGRDEPKPQSSGIQATDRPFTLSQRKDYLLALPSAWMRLWHRNLFMDTGIRYPSRVWYEDIRTTAKLLPLAAKILILPQPLYYYLSRPDSIMNNKQLERNREILLALDDILAWYREQGLFEDYREELCAMTVQHVLLAGSVRVARTDPKHPLLQEFYTYTETNFPEWKKNPYQRQLPALKRLALTLTTHRQYGLLKLLFRLKG